MCYEPDLLKIIMNPNTYSNIIISNVATEKAQKHYFTSILSLMNYSNIKNEHKDIYNEWYTHFASVKKKLYLNYLNQKPTEQQVDAHVEWETIIRNRDTMNKSKQDYILMCLITMIPPRRQLDWFLMGVALKTAMVTARMLPVQLLERPGGLPKAQN